jgi:hypothetical protein
LAIGQSSGCKCTDQHGEVLADVEASHVQNIRPRHPEARERQSLCVRVAGAAAGSQEFFIDPVGGDDDRGRIAARPPIQHFITNVAGHGGDDGRPR